MPDTRCVLTRSHALLPPAGCCLPYHHPEAFKQCRQVSGNSTVLSWFGISKGTTLRSSADLAGPRTQDLPLIDDIACVCGDAVGGCTTLEIKKTSRETAAGGHSGERGIEWVA
jgi:hypothetical protein